MCRGPRSIPWMFSIWPFSLYEPLWDQVNKFWRFSYCVLDTSGSFNSSSLYHRISQDPFNVWLWVSTSDLISLTIHSTPLHTPKTKHAHRGDTWTSMFITTLFIASKICHQPSCPPVHKQLNTMWCAHPVSFPIVVHTVIKEDGIAPFSGKLVDRQIVM